jgi:hypothetical protein
MQPVSDRVLDSLRSALGTRGVLTARDDVAPDSSGEQLVLSLGRMRRIRRATRTTTRSRSKRAR